MHSEGEEAVHGGSTPVTSVPLSGMPALARHDLANAVAAMLTAAETLRERRHDLPDETVDELLDRMVARGRSIHRLLLDLTALARSPDGGVDVATEPVRVADAVAAALDEVDEHADTAVSVAVPSGLCALADPFRLQQVLVNLIGNALRHGGPAVRIRARRDGDQVTISVSDDGGAIPDEVATRMFEPWARGPDSQRLGGSGLGLAVVRTFITAMGGTVSHHRGRTGTEFRVTLPAARPPTA